MVGRRSAEPSVFGVVTRLSPGRERLGGTAPYRAVAADGRRRHSFTRRVPWNLARGVLWMSQRLVPSADMTRDSPGRGRLGGTSPYRRAMAVWLDGCRRFWKVADVWKVFEMLVLRPKRCLLAHRRGVNDAVG